MEYILKWIVTIVGGCLLLSSLYMLLHNSYNIVLSFWGFGTAKKDYEVIEDKARFLILVAAHNEEAVISDTVSNLRKIAYNEDLYDIYIVNDNSSDRTGEICKEIGIKSVNTSEKRFEREGVGKPAGIQYALRELGFDKLKDNYDLLMVLDADNYVDSDILSEVNSQWYDKNKPEAIQTYLDSKNTTSLLSTGYATAYWLTNRFFQLAKYRLGLPNAIGGTGFVVRLDWLINSGGFCYKSLTEDLEMEIEIVKDGGRVLWNHHTRIYDEKPDDLKVSIKQRTRWAQGHWFVAFTNAKPLVKLFFKERKFKYVDQLIYLFSMGKGIQLLLMLLSLLFISFTFILDLNNVSLFVGTTGYYMKSLFVPTTILNIVTCIYSLGFKPVYALYKDGAERNILKAIIGVVYLGVTYMYTQMIGLFKWRNQSVWVKTPHKHTSKSV